MNLPYRAKYRVPYECGSTLSIESAWAYLNCICIPYLIFNRVSKLQCYYLMIRISSVTKILSMIHLAFYALIFNVVINLYILYL